MVQEPKPESHHLRGIEMLKHCSDLYNMSYVTNATFFQI